ncbi:hypothetical protein TNCT_577661 [Trichonephila clavata]|uniref:Uncharacterized protein n=1 Tax=Trichonephila clavata TaxID=2740835 RepID=A0A8X6J3C5_TRICU|nr:hypothetical protein TNCT_577661 [Trichonephila clavata]
MIDGLPTKFSSDTVGVLKIMVLICYQKKKSNVVHNIETEDCSQHFSFNRANGINCTNFDVEVAAVQLALTEIIKRDYQNIVMFIDSQSTLLK